MRIPVKFKDATEASKFVVICASYECDVNIYYKRYIIDAKSILGVLSCDLQEQLEVELLSDAAVLQDKFQKEMEAFHG